MGYENNGISKSDNSSLNPNISQLPPPSAVIQNGGPPATEASAAVTTSPGMATNANIFHAFVCVLLSGSKREARFEKDTSGKQYLKLD